MTFSKPRPTLPSQVKRAKAMRSTMTEPERKLWKALRWNMPIEGTHSRRQVLIASYIVDFCCLKARLVVEVDGNQHGTDQAKRYDEARSHVLAEDGFRVLRFSNEDVTRDIASVLDTIAAAMQQNSNSKPARIEGHTETHTHG